MADPTPAWKTCEPHRAGADPCGATAAFLVSRGRRHDAQLSCRRHLAATVDALCGWDSDTVTVEQIPGVSVGAVRAHEVGKASAMEGAETEWVVRFARSQELNCYDETVARRTVAMFRDDSMPAALYRREVGQWEEVPDA